MGSVGITDNVNHTEVSLISSPPHEENVDWFEVEEFDDLMDRLNRMIQVVEKECPKEECYPEDCVRFTYRGNTYDRCTTDFIPSGKPWCSNVYDFDHVRRPNKHFRYCICNTI